MEQPGISKTEERAGSRGEGLLFVVFLLITVSGLNAGWMGPFFPSIARIESISLMQAGAMVSVYFAGCIISMMSGRAMLVKFGARNCLKLSCSIVGSGLILVAVSSGIFWLWSGAFLIGLGVGVNSIAGTIVVLDSAVASPAASLNRFHLFFGFGALAGPLFAWIGNQTPWSYRSIYLAFGVIVLSIALRLLLTSRGRTSAPPVESADSWNILKSSVLWSFAIVLFLYVGIESATGAWIYTYLKHGCHLPPSLAAIGSSAFWGGMTAGRLTGMALCSRISEFIVTVSAAVISAIAIAMLAFLPEAGWPLLAVVGATGFGFGPIFPNVMAAATEHFPRVVPTVTTAVTTFGFVGGVAFPYMVASIFREIGLEEGFIALLAACLLMIGCFFLTRKLASVR